MCEYRTKMDEIIQLVMSPHAKYILQHNQDILFRYIPELLVCRGFNQKNPYHIYDVLEHTLVSVDMAIENPVVRVALLLHDIGKPMAYYEDSDGVRHFKGHGQVSAEIAQRVLKRLGAEDIFAAKVVTLIKWHDYFIGTNSASVQKLLIKVGPETFGLLLSLREADIMAQNPVFEHQRLDKVWNLRCIWHRIEDNPQLFSALH